MNASKSELCVEYDTTISLGSIPPDYFDATGGHGSGGEVRVISSGTPSRWRNQGNDNGPVENILSDEGPTSASSPLPRGMARDPIEAKLECQPPQQARL